MCDRVKGIFYKLIPEREKKSSESLTKRIKNVLCFYVFGTLTFFSLELLTIASQDILTGQILPTSTVLVCFVAPLTITKILAPWFLQKISYWTKTTAIALSMATGLSLIVFIGNIKLKMLGISLAAIATALSESVYLSLTSFYPHICISAYVAGTGMSALMSPFYYTGLTTWSCVSPKMAILITIPLPLFFLVSYALLDKENVNSVSHLYEEAEYSKLSSSSHDGNETLQHGKDRLLANKLRICIKIMPLIISLFLCFFAEYTTMFAIITSIAFPSAHISPRDHFLYYYLSYEVGKFVGRTHLLLFSFFPSEVLNCLRCNKTWIFAAIEMVHMLFFLLESWYHFVGFIWIVICLCFTIGLVSGMLYVNSPHAVSQYVLPEEREFSLSLLPVGNALGACLAGFVGLYVETFLEEKCTQHFPLQKQFCFTRSPNVTGWDNNIHC